MLEDGAILVPTDARADAIFDDQRLLERARIKTGKGGCSTAQRFEPSWQRIAGGKSAGLEIIGPAEGACPPFALPLLELERRQVGGCDAGNQLSLFGGRDEIVAVSEAGKRCCAKKVGLGRGPGCPRGCAARSEEHTSELQSLMRLSYAVFCLQKKK